MEGIIGLFKSHSHAENVLDALKSADIESSSIGVIVKKSVIDNYLSQFDRVKQRAEPLGAIRSASLGNLIGMVVGTGTKKIPEVGPLLVSGFLASSIKASGKNLTTQLKRLGLSITHAKKLQEDINKGCIMLSICTDRPALVNEIFERQNVVYTLRLSSAEEMCGSAATPSN